MFCGSCGAKNDAGFKFCDSCGAPLEAHTQAAAPAAPAGAKSVPAQPTPAPEAQSSTPAIASVNLTMWAGLRWLFAADYGQLSISEHHLNHQINKFWASNVYSIIAKVFTWGFDLYTSIFVNRGSTALRSITTVRVFALNWISWKGHFLFIWAGGLPDVYVFSTKQLQEVASFVTALKKAAAEAKYPVAK
jgi:hypothetical protein